jgi:hypothetical protein
LFRASVVDATNINVQQAKAHAHPRARAPDIRCDPQDPANVTGAH